MEVARHRARPDDRHRVGQGHAGVRTRAVRDQGWSQGGPEEDAAGRQEAPEHPTGDVAQSQAGRRLGDMLLAIIDGDDPKKHQELQRAQLVRRNTDGPPCSVPHENHVSVREEQQ